MSTKDIIGRRRQAKRQKNVCMFDTRDLIFYSFNINLKSFVKFIEKIIEDCSFKSAQVPLEKNWRLKSVWAPNQKFF